MPLNTNVYSTELTVRPDEIDFFKHVHSSRYMDYVLAARYDQMHRCYKMSLEEFLDKDMGLVILETKMNFKRALRLGDIMKVNTHIVSLTGNNVLVNFDIVNVQTNKISCDGYFNYTLIDLKSGKALVIPKWIIERFSI